MQGSSCNLVVLKLRQAPFGGGEEILSDLPPVWLLLVCLQTRRSDQMGWQRTHTHTELSGRAVNIYFVHHAEVIMLRAQDGVIFQR